MYYKRIFTFMFPVLYLPNETVYFLGFFTSWFQIRIRICPCGSGSRRHILMRIRADPDPKHCSLYLHICARALPSAKKGQQNVQILQKTTVFC